MGTNFYFHTKNKIMAEKYAGQEYTLTDSPDWAYEIHIAKTSAGWLPLFQYRETMPSVQTMKEAYDTGEFKIYDEYDREYNWEQFDERVLKFNGGVRGAIKTVKEQNEEIPISHFKYSNGMYVNMYLTDCDGFEFTRGDFS